MIIIQQQCSREYNSGGLYGFHVRGIMSTNAVNYKAKLVAWWCSG